MDQHQELLKLSAIIDFLKHEVGRPVEKGEKQDQYLDDLEQYERSNCLIVHGNNVHTSPDKFKSTLKSMY